METVYSPLTRQAVNIARRHPLLVGVTFPGFGRTLRLQIDALVLFFHIVARPRLEQPSSLSRRTRQLRRVPCIDCRQQILQIDKRDHSILDRDQAG